MQRGAVVVRSSRGTLFREDRDARLVLSQNLKRNASPADTLEKTRGIPLSPLPVRLDPEVLSLKLKVEVVRSTRRRTTIEATREGNKVVVRLPATLTKAEQRRWVAEMVGRIEQTEHLSRLNEKRDLEKRARELHQRYFQSRPALRSIRYVANQRDRYGSCTPADATIRLSHVLADFPDWVRDYVIVHELAHLRVADHSSYFWQLVRRYPHAERARGFLIAKGIEG